MMKKTCLPLFILTVILLTACSAIDSPTPIAEPTAAEALSNTVTAEGTLLPEGSVELAFAQGGVVKEILVQPGERVAEGDVIVRLIGVESVRAELVAAKLEQTLAQQALDAIHRNALLTSAQTERTLLDAQAAYESLANRWNLGNADEANDLELNLDDYVIAEEECRAARAKLDSLLDKDETNRERRNAQEDFDAEKESLAKAYADLKTASAENDQPLDEELADLLEAISALEVAREMQARLNESNLDPEILAAAEARLAAATARVAAAEETIKLYELSTPIDGILFNLNLKVGETALPMTPAAFVADTTRWIVETRDLAEVDVAKVSIGDPAVVKLDAFPDEEFAGTVTKIDPVGRLYLGDMTYQITITLSEADDRFLWNMTAIVTIATK